MTLTEFLLARIDEDEAVATAAVIKAWSGRHQPHPDLATWRYTRGGDVEYDFDEPDRADGYPLYYVTQDSETSGAVQEWAGPHIARWDPARVLAECAAKRAIVEAAARPVSSMDEHGDWSAGVDYAARLLADVYADHPDYQAKWGTTPAASPPGSWAR